MTGLAPGTLVPTPKLTRPGGEGLVPDVPFARQSRIDRLKLTGKYDMHGERDNDADDGVGGDDDDDDEKMQDGEEEGEKDGKKPPKSRAEKRMRGKNKSMKRYVVIFPSSPLCQVKHIS